MTILPRAADSAPKGFQTYFTCRACPYICPVTEIEYYSDESCSDETADDGFVDDKPAPIDEQSVEDESAGHEYPAEPLKTYIDTAVQEIQVVQDGQVTSLLADEKIPLPGFGVS